MKTIYITLLAAIFCVSNTKAQITLLSAFHEPIAGDKDGKKQHDSTAALPNTAGTGLTWDFSTLSMKTTAATTESYMASGSVSSSTLFTGDTLAGTKDNSNYNFYKKNTSPNAFELVGSYNATSTVNYSGNTKVIYAWPISFGTTNTDTYAATLTGSGMYYNITGTTTTSGAGTGNLILPSGTYTNVLQVKTSDMMKQNDTLGVSSSTLTTTRYEYYYSLQKFPILSVTYMNFVYDTISIKSTMIEVNYLLAVGLNDYNFDASFAIYPNPANDNFNVKLSNENNQNCVIEIYSALGQLVKTADLGNSTSISANVRISNLQSGIYIVKTTLGDKTSARRLIVE